MPHIVVSEALHGKLQNLKNDRMQPSLEAVIEKLLKKDIALDFVIDEIQFADQLLKAALPKVGDAVSLEFAKLRMRILEESRKV